MLLTLSLLAAPLAFAHSDGSAGYPKAYCEEDAADWQVHDYAVGSPVGLILLSSDAGVCLETMEQDMHYEHAWGGAFLDACEVHCGQTPSGSMAC